MIERTLAAVLGRSKKSVLLLGPRQTGKSTLIKGLLPDLVVNLAQEQTYLDFASRPNELEHRLASQPYRTVLIDEVQRLPSLLNTVQHILDDATRPPKFYLTGSSARKLRRGQANLLPGRLHTYHLGPLTCRELQYACNTAAALTTGMLPGIYTEPSGEDRCKTLRSYSATYLKEEVQAEALTRNLEGFSRFLLLAAQWSGQLLDLSKLAAEAQIARQSATRYFEVLEDTLLVHRCPPFSKSDRKRLVQHPRFFFFDTGVLNGLLGNFTASADRKGALFEHLFVSQVIAGAMAKDCEYRISSYRTEHGVEVDLIVEFGSVLWAIELKASTNVGITDLRGLDHFARAYGKPLHCAVGYLGTVEQVIRGIPILPWQRLLQVMGL